MALIIHFTKHQYYQWEKSIHIQNESSDSGLEHLISLVTIESAVVQVTINYI